MSRLVDDQVPEPIEVEVGHQVDFGARPHLPSEVVQA